MVILRCSRRQLDEITYTLIDHLLPLVAARGDGRTEHFQRVRGQLPASRSAEVRP